MRADVELARQLGIAPRRFLGEEPVRLAKRGPEGWTLTQTPEWTDLDRDLLRGLREVEARECRRCGGDLDVELTDKPPYEDDGDGHFHRFHTYWCRGCVDRAKRDRRVLRENEAVEGGPMDEFPAAQVVVTRRLPIPTD